MVTLALIALLAQGPPPAISGERSLVSKCEVSEDTSYGYTQENPIKVGGTPMHGPARQRRFLQALAGPAGQPLTFKRRGSLAPNPDGIILDLYEVTYPGLEKTFELYLDLYRWDPPRAPQGLLCATAINLAPPGQPDPMVPAGPARPPIRPRPPPTLSWDRIVALAIEWGQKEEISPVPLDEGAPRRYGVVFDPFTRIARVTRAAEAAGKPIAPALFADIRPVETLLVVFPIDCDGRRVTPTGVTMVAQGGRQIGTGRVLQGAALTRALPAFEAPEGSIGVMLRTSMVPSGQAVIVYDSPTCPAGQSMSFDIRMTMLGRSAPAGAVRWPEGVPGEPGTTVQVTVHGFVDHEGKYHDLKVVEGPEPFHAAALEFVRRSEPGVLAVNGVVSRLLRPTGHTLFFRPER